MDFSNREIATYIWLAAFVGIAALSHNVRMSFKNIGPAFWQPMIIIPLCIATAYISGIIFVLKSIGVWTPENLKTTILWAFSFAFATMLNINRVSEDRTFFAKAVREALAITGLLTFIVEFYSFSLPIELIAVPSLAFIIILNAAALKPEHAAVKSLTGNILSMVGIGYLGYSLYRAVRNLTNFATLNTLRELSLPILLTMLFLPFLYLMMLYAVYERSFVGLRWAIPDRKLRRHAKWYSIFEFGAKLELLQRWIGSIQRFPPSNKNDLKRSIQEMFTLVHREANPPFVPLESGWSPYQAKEFLVKEGLSTRYYHRSHEDEWFAGSNYLEIGDDDIIKNNIAYYLNGHEHTVTELKLVLNINIHTKATEAEHRFQKIALTLLAAALGHEIDKAVCDKISQGHFEITLEGKKVRIDKQDWENGSRQGYSNSLSIYVFKPN